MTDRKKPGAAFRASVVVVTVPVGQVRISLVRNVSTRYAFRIPSPHG